MKKRVLIYSEYWSTRGGGEKYLLCCIETLLRSDYDVTIVAQTASFDKDAVSQYFQITIDDAKVVFVDGDLKRLRHDAEQMSREFDICIYMTNYRVFHSLARQTYVVLQTPYGRITPLNFLTEILR